jgi:aspartate kinase
VQNVSTSATTDISFTIHESELKQTEKLLAPVVAEIGASGITARSGVAKLSVVGIGMRSHSDVAARLFDCLGKGGINIQLISTSDIKIAVVIEENELELAARLTHEGFGLTRLAPDVGLPATTID